MTSPTGLADKAVEAIQVAVDIVNRALGNDSIIFHDENIDSMDDRFFTEIKLSREDIKYLIDVSTLELKQRYWTFRHAAEAAADMTAITEVHTVIDFYWACLKSGHWLSDDEYTRGYLNTAAARIPSDAAWTQEPYIASDGDAWLVLAGLVDLGSQQGGGRKRPEGEWLPSDYVEKVSEIFYEGENQKNLKTVKTALLLSESNSAGWADKIQRKNIAWVAFESLRLSELKHLADYLRISELLSTTAPQSIRLEFIQQLELEINNKTGLKAWLMLREYLHDGEASKAYWLMHHVADKIIHDHFTDSRGNPDAVKLEQAYLVIPELLKKVWTADQMARACGLVSRFHDGKFLLDWEKKILRKYGASTALNKEQMKDYVRKYSK